MIDSFIISLEAVFPIFAILAIGMLVRKKGLITSDEIAKFNKVIFVVCYPALMFENLYGNELGEVFDFKLLVLAVSGVFFAFLLGTVTAHILCDNQKSKGAFIQAIYRSNFVIMGLPIVQNVFKSGNFGITAMLLAVVVPIYNISSVIVLEVYRGSKPDLKNILISVLKNPMILGAIAAFIVIGFGIELPGFVDNAINMLNAATTPIALLILGASFDLNSLKGSNKLLITAVLEKLIVVPAIVLTAAVLLGIRGIPLVTLIALFASPTALASFTMAQAMDSDGELAGNIVIFTSMLSCFTMFMWIFILKYMGMF